MAFIFGGIAAVGQGLGAVISKHGQSLSRDAGFPIDPFSVSYQRIVAGVVFGGVWWWIQYRRNKLDRPSPVAIRQNSKVPTVVWVLINGLSGPCLGVAAYQWALKHEPTGVVLSVTSLTPVAVIPISRWIDGDRASRRSLIGGMVAVAGVVALALNR
jgi:drug/metabolite transporter (DMT)-like permease